MTDLTQKVKYEVVVELDQLNTLKTALDAAEKAAKDLGTALDKLAGSNVKGLKSLGGTISSIGTRLEKFSTAVDPATTAFERLRTAMEKVGPAATTATRAVKEKGEAVKKTGDEITRASSKTEDWRLSMLKYYGTFHAVRYTVVNALAAIKEGAQQIDLDKTLTRQFANFNAEIARAKELTAGTVGRGQLTRSFALMSSFGIPMDQFAENMELVQKMSIRTGQSADFLADSFARGISRLSPLILDNLGIQVDLSDANDAYAASTGRLVVNMTKQEKTAALLTQVLLKLKDATKGIDLETGSAAASVNRFNVFLDDAVLKVKEMGGKSLTGLDTLFESARTSIHRLATETESKKASFTFLYDWFTGMGSHSKAAQNAASSITAMQAAFTEMAKSEAMSDLFGNAPLTGPMADFGTTTKWAREISAAAESRFLVHLEEVRARMEGLTTPIDSEMNWFSEENTSNAADVGGAIAVMALHLDAAKTNTLALNQEYATLIPKTIIASLQAKVFEDAQQRGATAIRVANGLMGNGLNFATNLAVQYDRQGEALRQALEYAQELYWRAAENVATNATIAGMYQGMNTALGVQVDWSQRLFDLRNGQLLTELELSSVEAQRSEALRRLAEFDKENSAEKLTTDKVAARLKLLEHVTALDRAREIAQANKAADAAMLASYKEKTKEQIKADAERIQSFAMAMRAMAEALKPTSLDAYQKHLEAAIDLENKAQEILKTAKGGGGGGGGGGPTGKAFQPSYWWEGLEMPEVEGDIEKLRLFAAEMERVRLARNEMKRALVEDPSGKEAADAYAEIMRQFSEMSDTFGVEYTTNVITRLLGEDFMPDIIRARDEVDKLTESFDRMIKVADGLRETSTLLGEFRKGMSSFHGDLFGGEFISMIDDLAGGFEGLADVIQKNAEATDKSHNAYNGILGSLPIMRAFTQNLIKDRRDQAKVEMLMQAAAAWAAFAIPDIPKAIAHTTAAAMYAAVGFGAVKLPSGKAKSTTPRESRNGGSGEAKRPDIHIHIAGNVVQTEAERGVMAQAAIQEARRRGML